MSNDTVTQGRVVRRSSSSDLTPAAVALAVAGVPFFIGGLLIIQTDTPPSLSPTLGMLSHALWALGITILAFGVAVLLRRVPELRRGLAGPLSGAVLALGVLHGLQWVTWAYVDVRGSREGEHDLVVDAIVVPFGAGHLLMYALLLGTGITLLAWALRRTDTSRSSLPIVGVVLGLLTVVTAGVSLVSAFGGGSEGHWLFDAATLLLPVIYLWAMALGIDVYRRSRPSASGLDPEAVHRRSS